MRNTGICKWFNPRKGFGFITRDESSDEDIFVHQTAIYASGFRSLEEGEQVEFEIEENNGKTVAINVSGPNGTYVRGNQRRFRTNNSEANENIKQNLEIAKQDLASWDNKEFNRDKIRKRLEFLRKDYERNEIYRVLPENRLTVELNKSVDYWTNRLEISEKINNEGNELLHKNEKVAEN